ncbi:MAG: hypothetical protein FWJ92_11390 [Actinomycetes bacterium]|jgi:hypothetical protein|nr:hypothetical protein [Acidimicrobiia bacterium]
MKIQPSDIEAKARQIQDALEQTKESAQNTAVLAGVAVFLFVLVAFLVGRRRGKKSRAVVEIYRL